MGVSRRTFLKGGASTIVSRKALMLSGISAALLQPEPARAWVQFALLALSAVSAFSKKGDGGLSATLGAMNQKLDLISSQLIQVQSSLADVMRDVQSVKELIVERSDDDLTRPFIADIQGAIIEYTPFFKAYPTVSTMRAAANRQKLESLLQRVVRSSTSLQASVVPQLPLVGATIPVALGLEVLILQILESDTNYIRQVEARYASWMDEILSLDSPRSIYIHVNSYLNELRNVWTDLQKYPGISLSGYDPFVQNAEDSIAELCHMSYEENDKSCKRWVWVGKTMSEGERRQECVDWEIKRGPDSLMVDRFTLKQDTTVGTISDSYSHERKVYTGELPKFIPKRQWKYIGTQASINGMRLGVPDPASQIPFFACTRERFSVTEDNALREARLQQSSTAKRWDQDNIEIAARVDKANEYRNKISLAMSAVLVLQNARNQIEV